MGKRNEKIMTGLVISLLYKTVADNRLQKSLNFFNPNRAVKEVVCMNEEVYNINNINLNHMTLLESTYYFYPLYLGAKLTKSMGKSKKLIGSDFENIDNITSKQKIFDLYSDLTYKDRQLFNIKIWILLKKNVLQSSFKELDHYLYVKSFDKDNTVNIDKTINLLGKEGFVYLPNLKTKMDEYINNNPGKSYLFIYRLLGLKNIKKETIYFRWIV